MKKATVYYTINSRNIFHKSLFMAEVCSENKKQKMIDFLLKNANPSIKLRVKKEVLNSLSKEEEEIYQNQIMKEPNIQKIIGYQKENGWIGDGFHDYLDSQEGGTKYLGEKGLKGTPVLNRAMEAFATIPLDDFAYNRKGRYIDEFKYVACGQQHDLKPAYK